MPPTSLKGWTVLLVASLAVALPDLEDDILNTFKYREACPDYKRYSTYYQQVAAPTPY